MGHGRPPGSWNGPDGLVAIDDGTSARTEAPPPGAIGLKGGNAKQATSASMADRIVSFAAQRRSQSVGGGQCFDLVDRAVRSADAKSAAEYGEISPDADYVWGTPVSLADLRPGDIIQFRNYEFTRTVVTETSSETRTDETAGDRPHHTAIVERVGSGGEVTVLEQNAPEGSPVTRATLYFTAGTTRSGNRTITISVSGTWWLYRPQPR
jgi:hypothetical protein